MEHIVVVGASLAGVRAAETLRSEGFEGRLTIVGDEIHRPYDRPPLSKQVLTGEWDADRVALPAGAEGRFEATWNLGRSAVSLDPLERTLALDNGAVLNWDGLVVATGASPRQLPGTSGIAGVHTLRSLDDSLTISKSVGDARHVTVVGAGFIGCEVAASCRARGVEVTIVEQLPQPLSRVIGDRLGSVVAELHRSNGVDLRTNTGITGVSDSATGPVISLDDGSELHSDLVVVGIGVSPNTAWLHGSGLAVDDGLLCDATTLVAPGIVAAGDVARWPNSLYGETMRVEHWEHALDMASHAARRLLADAGGEPEKEYRPVPWFWSDQFDRKFQLAGRPRPDDDLAVIAGSLDGERFCALLGRDDRVSAVFAMNMAGRVVRHRRELAEGIPWERAVDEAEANGTPVEAIDGSEPAR